MKLKNHHTVKITVKKYSVVSLSQKSSGQHKKETSLWERLLNTQRFLIEHKTQNFYPNIPHALSLKHYVNNNSANDNPIFYGIIMVDMGFWQVLTFTLCAFFIPHASAVTRYLANPQVHKSHAFWFVILVKLQGSKSLNPDHWKCLCPALLGKHNIK